MFTVRFPNGQAVQYNTATFAIRGSSYTDIYKYRGKDDKGEGWIAHVPNTCIIENVPACRVYDAVKKETNDNLAKEISSLKRKLNKALKK